MMVNTNQLIPMTGANQNFSMCKAKIAEAADAILDENMEASEAG